jgi:hypothetical protein
VSFAKEKSDLIAKLDGTFHIRERPESYFQDKFNEKFRLRPQQARTKVEREKNVLKIDKVPALALRSTTCPTTSSSARGSPQKSLSRS